MTAPKSPAAKPTTRAVKKTPAKKAAPKAPGEGIIMAGKGKAGAAPKKVVKVHPGAQDGVAPADLPPVELSVKSFVLSPDTDGALTPSIPTRPANIDGNDWKKFIHEVRARDVLWLRWHGWRFEDIAKKLDIHRSTVAGMWKEGLKKGLSEEDIALMRHDEAERMNMLLKAMMPKALDGDIYAVDRVLNISKRKAALFGLDRKVVEDSSKEDGDFGSHPSGPLDMVAGAEADTGQYISTIIAAGDFDPERIIQVMQELKEGKVPELTPQELEAHMNANPLAEGDVVENEADEHEEVEVQS